VDCLGIEVFDEVCCGGGLDGQIVVVEGHDGGCEGSLFEGADSLEQGTDV
jgi:hypothetical protein